MRISTPSSKQVEILRKRAQFREIYSDGEKIRGRLFTLFLVRRKLPCTTRFGVSVTRRIKNAHERNKLRRRCREILRKRIDYFEESRDVVINIHQEALRSTFVRMERELTCLLQKAGILKRVKEN